MKIYSPRIVDTDLAELLSTVPAVALEGPKGVGKTESALRLAATIRRCDRPAEQALGMADPDAFLRGASPVLLDEWQRVPAVWDAVKRAVDADAAPGHFLLTGSSHLMAAGTHSGAGRIVAVRMRPMTLSERGVCRPSVSLRDLLTGSRPGIAGECPLTLADYTQEIVASGFPGLRTFQGRALRAQLDGYLARIVDTDFEELGLRIRRPDTLRRWLAAYAAATATTASYETIRDAASSGDGRTPAKSTTIPYRDILQRLWIIDPLPAWIPSANAIARLSPPPKHHLADPALAARLLGMNADRLLAGASVPQGATPLLGTLFESLATLCLRVCAQAAEARPAHLRVRSGQHEIDLIIERDDGRVVALEIKLGVAVNEDDVRHLHWLKREIGERVLDLAVINTGPQAYRRPDGVAVIPLGLIGC